VTTDSLSYTLFIKSSPFNDESNQTAAAFAAAVLDSGNKIDRVFFYQDAVFTANAAMTPPQGQAPHFEVWTKLKTEFNFPLQVCIANGLRRGILDENEAKRYDKQVTIHPDFELCGLGEIAEAMQDSDRIITF